jgi:hypothetical protein
VTAGGKHRAYLVSAFTGPTRLIVNDLLGDVPVTVTCAERTKRCRVFTGGERGRPLGINLAGWLDGKMVLSAGKQVYVQESGKCLNPSGPPFPFAELPAERTTWKAWKEAHPDTTVYAGGAPLEPGGPPRKR